MTTLFRIAVIGTKGESRRYVSGTADEIEFAGRVNALHWDKRVAKILVDAFNAEFERANRPERLQIEKS